MKTENQVCTQEQAKRLKELGVCQDSEFYWRQDVVENSKSVNSWCDQETLVEMIRNNDKEKDAGWRDKFCIYSAFTVAELGVMLPGKFQYNGVECFVETVKYCNLKQWIAGIHTVWAHDKPVVAKKYLPADTEAEARASLLIYLLGTGVIAIVDVNKRLQIA